MRQFQRLVALCLFVDCVIVSTCGAEEFPYVGYVRTKRAAIHSGPGQDYYVTDRLERGSEVEVYRHDDEAWCAIRPPEGSFSWVKKRQLKRTADPSLGTVVGDAVFTHVGTRFGDEHNVKYIKLSPGEVVEILGSKRLSEPHGTSTSWYKVAPPAGEFRWIRLEHIDRNAPSDAAVAVPESRSVNDTEPVEVVHASMDSPEGKSQVNADAAGNTASPPSDDKPAAVPRAIDSGHWSARNDSASPPLPMQGRINDSASLVYDLLDAIDIELSLSVAQSPTTWNLDELKRKTEAVIDTSNDAARRDRARDLLAKIAKFQDLQRRYLRLFGPADKPVTDELVVPGVVAAGSAGSIGTSSNRQLSGGQAKAGPSSQSNPYDGTGWLMRVITQHQGVPQYALTDAQGRILHFVTPSPGINLRRYERQEVGVVGRRGYIPRLQKPHLTAERIIVLDRHRR